MQFSQEPIPDERSQRSIELHGADTPFRHWDVMRRYIKSLVDRNGYPHLISYSTTVERAEKIGSEWKVTLRKEGKEHDYWWVEWFDAVVVASGHYSVPYIPSIPGLEQFEKSRPGSVVHSKHFRGRDLYKDKVSSSWASMRNGRADDLSQRLVVVGASVSAADLAFDLVDTAKAPVHAITIGHTPNGYFGDEAFNHP